MKTVPSIYDLEVKEQQLNANSPNISSTFSYVYLQNLKVAKLTHPFHCCAFKYPEQHNPQRHAQHEEKIKRGCQGGAFSIDTGQARRRRRAQEPTGQ